MSALTVGVPKEIKTDEHRVAMTPDGVRELERHGVDGVRRGRRRVGLGDRRRRTTAPPGATIVADRRGRLGAARWSCKVKEPQAAEFALLRADLTLFTYLHLAAYPDGGQGAARGAARPAIAYETVQLDIGALPLLAPMSEVAGRMATQIGAHYLERHNGGRGVLLGGAPGVRPGRVVVLGAGNVGWNAAWIAAGMEAEVAAARQEPRPAALGRPDPPRAAS